MNKKVLISLAIILVLLAIVYRREIFLALSNTYLASTSSKVENRSPIMLPVDTSEGLSDDASSQNVEVIAENLNIPWEIAFLPDGSLLVTERPGTIVRLMANERKTIPVSGVEHIGEGGLLGLVLHPDYENNQWLYLYHTTRSNSGLINRVDRFTFNEEENSLDNGQLILGNIPGSTNHDGGRLAFGPDNLLYITTGDAGKSSSAQDTESLAGKILRVKDDGSIPEDNPFESPVYSYGHRNPQGLSWDSNGQLWSTEHGPSGVGSGFDEVNLIEMGGNYGWPTIQGSETQSGIISPVIQSGGNETWAPADSLVIDSVLLFPGLRGQALYSAAINGGSLSTRAIHFQNEYGRLRVAVLSPDQEWIYLATSNQDGRGRPVQGDDKIIRINKAWFMQEIL